MGDQISWLLELAIKEGQLDAFRALVDEMVESTRAEPGTLSYAWFTSDDGATVHIYERYADSDAVLAHLATFGERFAGRFLGAVDVTRFTVYGTPSDEAAKALSGMGGTFLRFFNGFTR